MGAPDVVKIFYHRHDFSDRRDARNRILSTCVRKTFLHFTAKFLAINPLHFEKDLLSLRVASTSPVIPKPRSFSGTQSIIYHDTIYATKLLK